MILEMQTAPASPVRVCVRVTHVYWSDSDEKEKPHVRR